jgi:predicted nucleic acid-binding protein
LIIVVGAGRMMICQNKITIWSLKQYLRLTDAIKELAGEYQKHKIRLYDSLHLATAEAYSYDILFTTDYNFCRDAQGLSQKVKVYNPLVWYTKEYCDGTSQY